MRLYNNDTAYPIITDTDIVMTDDGASNDSGKTLHQVISEHDHKIEKLESNIKWMYRYGALGSGGTGGGGGGGGSTSKMTVFIYKDGTQPISPGTRLMYPGEGLYRFKIEIHGGGNDTYLVKYYYNNGRNTLSRVLSKDNEFSTEDGLRLEGNNELTLTIMNQSTKEFYTVNDSANLTFPYVTSAYNITANYVFQDSHKQFIPSNNLIFMDDVATSGLMLAVNYNIAVQLQDSSTEIEYTDWENRNILINHDGMHITDVDGITTTEEFDIKIASNSAGILYLPLASDIHSFLSSSENAAFKQLTLIINSQLSDETEPMEFARFNFFDNLIPNGLFLNIKTNAGKLYDNVTSASTASLVNQITIGDIGFKVTPYNGSLDTTRPYELRTYVYNIINNEDILIYTGGPISLIDQRETDIIIPVTEAGVKKISFELTLTSTGEIRIYSYYILARTFTSSFNWYPDDISTGEMIEPYFSATYRRNETPVRVSSPGLLISGGNNIQITSNDPIRTIKLDYTGYNNIQVNTYDILMGLGIQYSSINNINIPILSFNISGSTDNKKLTHTIFLYQNKISITTSDTNITSADNIIMSSQDISIFIPLEDDYKPATTDKYHMINIYKRFENNIGLNYYRSFSTYIDGILEGLLNTFSTVDKIYDSITLYPGNYTINLLELSLFNHTATTTNKVWLEDIDINRYYKSYNEKIIHGDTIYDITDAQLFNFFNNFKIDEKNRVLVDYDDITNIAKTAKCPVMMLDFYDSGQTAISTELNNDNFMTWFEQSYKETQETTSNIPVTIYYADGNGSELKRITLPDGGDALFSVDIQGSSTKEYRCKNLELYAPSADEDYDYIYTPNINKNINDIDYTSSFLPEGSFTLKADVVDSSHTNNNAIGKFVNDNTTPFSQARYNVNQHGEKYTKNIKNTLIGFPILLFLHTSYEVYVFDNTGSHKTGEQISTYYFLGIFNFNLGRKSYYNLGYKDISLIEPLIDAEDAPDSGFAIYKIGSAGNVQINNIVGGEIQGNNQFFDFSQYSSTDPTLLFDSKSGMWGDYIGNKDLQLIQTDLANLCKEVAFAGGFVFTEIGKKMSTSITDAYGYSNMYSKVTKETDNDGNEKYVEWVPNYHYQASVKQQTGSTIEYIYEYFPRDGIMLDLINLIVAYRDETTGEDNIPRIDYVSVAEYYTIMMAMGLVDSPMKNLNMKSWNNGKTFYAAFYDMDTGLGKSNAGSYINYFAFSDFWSYRWIKKQNTNIGTLEQVDVIRDYAPESFADDETSSSFFDVPSSYLFAIVKYAKTILNAIEGGNHYTTITQNDPSNIWGKWRKDTGCLRNAKYFMETYFNHHLANVPEEAFNFNYRYKYLVKNNNNTGFDSLNFMKFHGRGQAYTEYWLDGRLHILDAYFNVSGIDDTINIVDNRAIKAPHTDISDYIEGMGRNEDVYILQDAFSGSSTALQYPSSSSGYLTIEAKQYSPMIIEYPLRKERYLFPSNGESSEIFINFTGTVSVLFGGSKLWTYVSSITPFINLEGKFTMHSKYISTLIGESRTCNSWTFDTPAIRTLRLTSPGYSGDIKFESSLLEPSYQNLDEIVISNTAINLSVENIPLRKLHAINMQRGAEISAIGCDKLEDVQISGVFNNLRLSSWSNDVSLPTGGSLTCNIISITNNIERFPEATLRISNNTELTTLNVSGFTHIYVNNCPKLETINFGDNTIASTPLLKTLDVQLPRYNDEQTFTIGNETNVVDLSNFKYLETLRLTNTTISYVILPNKINEDTIRNITLLPRAFNNCKNFVNFKNEEGNKMYITGEGTFFNCGSIGTIINDKKLQFNLVQEGYADNVSDPTITNLWVHESCPSLKDTFNCTDGKGQIIFNVASKFLLERCNDCNNVTSIENMFKNNSINYSFVTGATEYLNETCSLSLGMFTSCILATDVFSNNNVEFMNKYMFVNDDKIFAQNLPSISLTTMSNTFSSGTIDVFEFVINKTTSIDFKQQSNLMIYKPEPGRVSNLYNTYDYLEVEKIFYYPDKYAPTKLNNIRNFSISPTYISTNGSRVQKFTFVGLFDNDKDSETDYVWTTAHQQGLTLQGFMNASYTIKNYDESGVNILFKNLVPTYIVNCLAGFNLIDNELNLYPQKLNIYTMFNWEKVSNKTIALFTDEFTGSALSYGGLNCKKYCEYQEFKEIWSCLIKSTKLKGITSIFTNCEIYNRHRWNSNEEFILTDIATENTSITTVPNLFSDLSLIQDDISVPINITTNFFKNIKNLIYVANIFENTYMKHAIPFNLFNKRKKNDKETPCYILKDGEYVNGRIVQYDYDNTIVNMNSAFMNVIFENKQQATFKHNYDNNDYNVIKRNYAYIPGEETHYNEYYLYEWVETNHQYEYIRYDIEQPTELQDIDNLYNGIYRSTYSSEVIDYSSNRRTYKNLTNFCPEGFVVSPDIFRCCVDGCNIYSALKVTNRNKTNQYDPVVMTGMLPPSLFGVSYLRKIDFNNTLYGLNVTPIYMGIKNNEIYEYDDVTYIITDTLIHQVGTIPRHNICYQFVWDNFTERENLSECFNFMLLLPSTTSEYDNNNNEIKRTAERFYMFSDTSFTKDVLKLTNTLPLDVNHVILEDMDVDHMHNYYLSNNEIHFNIMGYIDTRLNEETGEEITGLFDGINPQKYRSLIFNSLINGDIAKIYSGYVISSNTTWRNIYINNDTVFYQVGGNNTGWIGLSSNARIQVRIENDGFFPRVGTGYHINKTSLSLGSDFIDNENHRLYWQGYIWDDLIVI